MSKKSLVIVSVALGLLVMATAAFAWGPGYGCPFAAGYNNQYDEKTAEIQSRLYKKSLEMNALLNQAEPDKDKVIALQKEMNELRNQLSEKRMADALEFKKRNPDWNPGANGYGPGRGYGRGRGGHGRGGYGQGYCWR